MPARLKYVELAPEGFAALAAQGRYLNTGTTLTTNLLDFVRLLASLLNGCEYCIHLHTAELLKLHEPATRIGALREWRTSTAYTHRERAAFAWTDALTNIQDGHAADPVYEELRAHFDAVETVNLTLAITTINAWNRIAIALGDFPGHTALTGDPQAPSAPPQGDEAEHPETEGDAGKVTVDDQ